MKSSIVITVVPIALDVETSAAMLGIGRSTFLERVSRGVLPRPRKLGTRSVWLVEELQEAVRGLPVGDIPPPQPVPDHSVARTTCRRTCPSWVPNQTPPA